VTVIWWMLGGGIAFQSKGEFPLCPCERKKTKERWLSDVMGRLVIIDITSQTRS
jgi:hypothetical protein